MSVTYEQLRTAALELIGFAEHSDFCDWHEKKPCSCGYTAAYDVIREAGKSTFTPDGKTVPALTMKKMEMLVECSPTPAAFALPDGEFNLYTHPVDDTALLRQALEALEASPDEMVEWRQNHWEYKRDLAITALRERLEGKV